MIFFRRERALLTSLLLYFTADQSNTKYSTSALQVTYSEAALFPSSFYGTAADDEDGAWLIDGAPSQYPAPVVINAFQSAALELDDDEAAEAENFSASGRNPFGDAATFLTHPVIKQPNVYLVDDLGLSEDENASHTRYSNAKMDGLEARMVERTDAGTIIERSTTTIRTGQLLVIHLPIKSGLYREFLWKLNATYDDTTSLVNREQLQLLGLASSASLQFLMEKSGYIEADPANGQPAKQQLVYRGMEAGVIDLPFIYNRPWYSDQQQGSAIAHVHTRVLQRRSIVYLKKHTPETRSKLTLQPGERANIKLANSLAQPFNVWKLMNLYDPKTGHILSKAGQPSLIEFIFQDSGYVKPESAADEEAMSKSKEVTKEEDLFPNRDVDPKFATDPPPALSAFATDGVNKASAVTGNTTAPAGYQKFAIFARAPGKQVLHFSFLKPWLPDVQFDRVDTEIEITVSGAGRKGVAATIEDFIPANQSFV